MTSFMTFADRSLCHHHRNPIIPEIPVLIKAMVGLDSVMNCQTTRSSCSLNALSVLEEIPNHSNGRGYVISITLRQ